SLRPSNWAAYPTGSAPLSNPTSGMARCCALAGQRRGNRRTAEKRDKFAPVHLVEVHQEPNAGSAWKGIELAQISQQLSRGRAGSAVGSRAGARAHRQHHLTEQDLIAKH